MSWKKKVVWSEGLFLRPQHFQQQERYLEALVEGRGQGLQNHSWGFTELVIDRDQLGIGKLAIEKARGIFPDGTPFNIPEDAAPPAPLDITEEIRDTRAYLALPVRQFGSTDFKQPGDNEGLGRYVIDESDVRDNTLASTDAVSMRVGGLRLSLLLDDDERAEYNCLGIADVIESKADKQVILNEHYLPPLLDCQVSARLSGFLNELNGLIHHRGEALAGRVSAGGRGGTAEIADFLLLQAVNRVQPLMAHLTTLSGLHPESLYQWLVSTAGELATFTSPNKRPAEFPQYDHDDLQTTFEPVERALRESLSMVLEQSAIPIELKEPRYGIRVGPITDRSLLAKATFVLAVQADLPAEKLRKRFPSNSKIGSVEKIRELVVSQLPGIPMRALPVAPRQIPYNAGAVYFELDSKSDYWPDLNQSGGFAIHVSGDFPSLEMEFWAIRG